MRKFVLFSLILSTLLSFAEPISNVRAIQEGNTIVLLYDLSTNQRVTQVNILIDNHHRVIPEQCLTGDIHKDVAAGTDRRIVYDVLADYADGYQGEVEFMIFSKEPFAMSQAPIEQTQAPASKELTTESPAPAGKPATTHRAVDLGLSVKWAPYNIGATTPIAAGDYFAWGETSAKTSYTKANHTIDHFEDAAIAQWGGNWRIPTAAEWNELKENCTWKWGSLNGVFGYKVTSKKNGNSIFLPAVGWRENYSTNDQNYCGYYWLTLLNPNDPNQARSLYIDEKQIGVVNRDRYTGRCLRAVCP